jgi:hypothetical protein
MNQSLPLETKSSNQTFAQPPPSVAPTLAEIDPEPQTDENLPWPPNISLCTTSQLAYLFNKLCDEEDSKVSSNQREIVKEVALRILSTPIERQTLFQLPALAIMKDEDILKKLMQVLVKKISDETFVDLNTLRALSQVVRYGQSNPNMVLVTLRSVSKTLLDKIPAIDEALIFQCLESLTDLLDAVMTLKVCVEGDLKDISSCLDCLKTSSTQRENPVAGLIEMELEYANQALLQITSQKTDLQKNFESTYKIVKGVVAASCAVLNRDPNDLIDEVINIYEEAKKVSSRLKDKENEVWFSHVRFMKVYFDESHFEKFRNYYQKLFRSDSLRKEIFFAVINLLNKVICKKEVLARVKYMDATCGESEVYPGGCDT